MAEISAADVMKLRKMSGQGMMDCKQALAETDGNVEKAMELLRKKGLATMAKRAGRDTSEGKIVFKVSADGKSASMASLCCETDFVAKSDDFNALAETMGKYMLACDAEQDPAALANTAIAGKKLSELITDTVAKTGEKTEVGEYTKYKLDGTSVVGSYVHFNGKVASMVEIATSNVSSLDSIKAVACDVAMHVTAAKPIAVDRNSVDPVMVAKEREIAAEQVKGKPANIIEKIVDGKMGKFFADYCLVDQKFVKNEEIIISKLVSDAAKKVGGTATIKRFVRFEIS